MSNEFGKSDTNMSRRRFIQGALAAGTLGSTGATLLASGARAATAGSREVLTGSHWGRSTCVWTMVG
jgi:trimethylamine-N-oxide reductase (cytochrome c)